MDSMFANVENLDLYDCQGYEMSQLKFKTFDFPQLYQLTFEGFVCMFSNIIKPNVKTNTWGNIGILPQNLRNLDVLQPEDLSILIFHPGALSSPTTGFICLKQEIHLLEACFIFFNQMMHLLQPDDSCSWVRKVLSTWGFVFPASFPSGGFANNSETKFSSRLAIT